MKKKIKLTLLLALMFTLFAGVIVKADYNSANSLVDQAISRKSFYYYNMAYAEIMKLTNEKEKNKLLSKLDTIASQVWNNDIKSINKTMKEMVYTSSGRIYDNLEATIKKANIAEEDKTYFLSELASWGRKLIWDTEYSNAVNSLMTAFKNKDAVSYLAAKEAIGNMKNDYNKQYLLEQLNYINTSNFEVQSME